MSCASLTQVGTKVKNQGKPHQSEEKTHTQLQLEINNADAKQFKRTWAYVFCGVDVRLLRYVHCYCPLHPKNDDCFSNLVSGGGKDLVDLCKVALSGLLSLLLKKIPGLLLMVEGVRLHPALVLKLLEEVLVLPANLVGEVTEDGVVATGLEADNAEGCWDYSALLLVKGVGDALKSAEAAKGVLATGTLLVDHAADGAPDHLGRGLKVVGATARVSVHALLAELGILAVLRMGTSEWQSN